MADHHDLNIRNAADDIAEDDPLAELARIIGYERPQTSRAEVAAPQTVPDADVFDLEAELMRELEISAEPVEAEAPVVEPEATAAEEPAWEPPADFAAAEDDEAHEAHWDVIETELEAVDLSLEAEDIAPEEFAPEEFSAQSVSEIIEAAPETVEAVLTEEPVAAEERHPATASETPVAVEEVDPFDAIETLDEELVIDERDLALDPAETTGRDAGDEVAAETPEVETDVFEALVDWPEEQAASEVEPEAIGPVPAEPTVAPAPAIAFAPAPVPAPIDETDHDDILADISRFELPDHGATQPTAEFVESVPATVEPADFSLDVSGDELAAAAPASAGEPTAGVAMPDFEDELSAELDIYRHEIEISAADEDEAADIAIAAVQGPDDASIFDAAAEDFLASGEGGDFDATNALDLDAELGSALAGAFDDLEDHEVETHSPAVPVFAEPSAAPAAAEIDGTEIRSDDEISAAFRDFLPVDRSSSREPASEDWPEEFDLQEDLAALDAAARHHAEPDLDTEARVAAVDDEPVLGETNWLDAMEGNTPQPAVAAASVAAAAAAATTSTAAASRPAPVRDMGADAFDISAIAETGHGLDVVRDLDVPAMPHVAEPDLVPGSVFEDEIEREFADLVEQDTRDLHPAAPVDWQARSGEEPQQAGLDSLEDALEGGLLPSETAEMAYRPRPVPVDADQALRAAEARQRREETGSRGPFIAFAVLGAAVLFGGVALGWSYLSGDSEAPDGGPRIIRADREPIKVAPENPGGLTVPNQDKAVYDRVAGTDASAASQPKLVTTAEEPVDVVQRTLDPDILPLEGREEADAGKAEDRLTEGEVAAASGEGVAAPVEPVVSPRKVRTMIVRPDGTIVAREEPVTEPATPQAPTVAAAPETPAPLETAAAAPAPAAPAPELRPAVEEAAAPAVEPAEAPAAVAETPTAAPAAPQDGDDAPLAPVRVVKTTPITNAPVPTARPADQPVNVVGTVTETGRVTDTAPAPAATNPGGYYIQIASQPTPEGAQASYQTLSNRYANLIGGRGVDIQRADIPGKGVFHRVRIPAGDRAAAVALCNQYKAAGGSCLVTR